MEFVDMILMEFEGQLSYNDIMHMTHKEITYLREHRKKMKAAMAPKMPDIPNIPGAPKNMPRNIPNKSHR